MHTEEAIMVSGWFQHKMNIAAFEKIVFLLPSVLHHSFISADRTENPLKNIGNVGRAFKKKEAYS